HEGRREVAGQEVPGHEGRSEEGPGQEERGREGPGQADTGQEGPGPAAVRRRDRGEPAPPLRLRRVPLAGALTPARSLPRPPGGWRPLPSPSPGHRERLGPRVRLSS